MSGISLPAPGTLAAVDRGCRCHDIPTCPLHGSVVHDRHPRENGEADARRTEAPVRLSGDAWGGR